MPRSRFSGRQILIAVAAFLVFLLLADFNNRWNEKQRLTVQHEQALLELEALESTQTALEAELVFASSDTAVAAWAYEQGAMVKPGDVVVVPLPAPGGSPTATPAPEIETETRQNWEIWWAIFFDE